MFRKFKGLFTLLAILCVSVVAGGSAYFYFGGQESKEESIDNNVEPSGDNNTSISADNILENYEFGKPDLNETYTYYFFPSTLYMELYKNGQNPETVFGYNEVVLNDSGDPALTSDGQPMYNIVTENSVGVKDTSYDTYYEYLVNSLNNNPSYYLYGDVIETSDYSTGSRYYDGAGEKGDDISYDGFLDTLADPYVINNAQAYESLLYNQYVGNGSYFTTSTTAEGSDDDPYNLTSHVYQNGKIVNGNVDKFAFSKSEEYLSPIYGDKNFGISRELTDGYKKNANMFASFYQKKNSNQSRLDSVSISDVSIDYDYRSGGLTHRKDFDADKLTNRTLSTYLNVFFGKDNLHDYIDFDLNSQNYIGAWSSPTQNTNLSLVLLNSSQGYVVDNSNYASYYFEYSVDDDGRCEFDYGRRSNRVSGKFTITQGDPYGQMMQKAQYRNDRFGFWAPFYDWNDPNNTAGKTEYSASRYLPIKITVNGNLTPDDMAKIIPSVESSMFDNHLYFDFTANGWTYVKKSGSELKDSELEYQSAVGGFTAKDLDYIFDIMQNPSKYASVENGENVIRLFPVFSNGKNYKSNPDQTVSAANGAGDALRANFLYTDDAKSTIKNDALVSETKLNYDSLEYSYTYTHKPIEVRVEGPSGGPAFSGTLSEYTLAEVDSSETTPGIFYGTWTGVLEGEGAQTIDVTIVINEGKTGSYNDMSFTYTVEGNNKILGTTKDGYKITITYIPQTVSYEVNYGVLKTVELKKGKYEQISFNIEPASEASANWQGNWIQTHVLTGSAIDSFISKYGEGLYTFYYIIGNRMKSNDLGSSLSSIGWNSNLISFLTNNTDPKNNLRNKTLLTINQAEGASKINVNQGDSYKFAYNNYPNIIIGERSRPVVLAVEKVTNLRLVTDIPIKEDDSGKPTGDQDWDAIDKNIQQGLNNAQNAIIADEVYAIDSYTDEISDTDLTESNRLDDDNPYIYLIQNADFRFVNNLYFQIRYSNDYIPGGMNVRTVYPNNDPNVPKYVAYKANGQIMKFFYQNSDEGIFINNTEPIKGTGTVLGENEQEQQVEIERTGFKLANYNARGIYDILLVSTGFDVSTGTQNFDMYINRHKNNFIKLFDRNPGVFDYPVNVGGTDENDKFVSHKLPTEIEAGEESQVRADTSSLIWNGQTYLGEYLATSTTGTGYGDKVDKVEEVFSENETFIDSIKRTLGVTPGKDTIYPIIDAVTNKTIAYYNAGIGRLFTAYGSTDGLNGNNLDLFTTMKNYVLYIGDPIKSSL